MKTRTVLRLAAVLASLSWCAPGPAGAGESAGDEASIQALVARINEAWKTPEGAAILGEVLSDNGFAVAIPDPDAPARARVFRKDTFCAAIDRRLRAQPPRHRSHDTRRILVRGPLAYEFSVISTEQPSGERRMDENLNVFAREDAGWRLVTGIPLEPVRAALAAEHAPAAENRAADEAAVLRLVAAVLNVARGNEPVSRLADLLMPDFIQSSSLGTVHRGVKENMDLYEQSIRRMHQDFARMDIAFLPESVKVQADSALAFGKVAFQGATKDGRPWERQVWETLVCVRTNGQWRLAHEHSSVVRAQAPADGQAPK